MENFDFQVAVHQDTVKLDRDVLRWAFAKKIIQSNSELEIYRKEKINFFAGYLFPETSFEKLEWIMKMFLWLFVLDDRLDKEQLSISRSLIWGLKNNQSPTYAPPFSELFNVWRELDQSSPGIANPEWKIGWNTHWSTFLSGMEWELNNKYYGKIPNLSDYKFYRPHLSGVYMALHYLKLDYDFVASSKSELLENKIARWICLGNALISAKNEEMVGDFHNELFLHSRIISGRKAKTHMENELQALFRHIQKLEAELLIESPDCNEWISGLNLLMGGCVYWSNDVTVRYGTYVNGVDKT